MFCANYAISLAAVVNSVALCNYDIICSWNMQHKLESQHIYKLIAFKIFDLGLLKKCSYFEL